MDAKVEQPATTYPTFRYNKPDDLPGGKGIVHLAKSDIIRGRVQVVREGGENNLHSHKGMDGFWMVLKGRVRFYGPGDVVIGEFGEHEGILLPRGAQYWFEKTGEGDLEILQMAAFEKGVKLERVNHEAIKFDPNTVQHVRAER
jgi:mannose-6-phosphate isomerase-like protein (cupin superfamily)